MAQEAEIDVKLDYLARTKTLIRLAMENKGLNVDDSTTFRDYADLINSIAVQIDQSDATALADDIVLNKIAYNDNQRVVGTIPVANTLTSNANTIIDNSNVSLVTGAFTTDIKLVLNANSNIQVNLPYNSLANAIGLTADKIKQGETIIGVNGTLRYVDTSDANATPSDIANGATAYVNFSKITGNLTTIGASSYASDFANNDTIFWNIAEDNISFRGVTKNDILLRKDSLPFIGNKISNIFNFMSDGSANKVQYLTARGYVNPANVVRGTTVMGVAGTYEGGAGEDLEAEISEQESIIAQQNLKIAELQALLAEKATGTDTSDATATAGDILLGKTAYVNGVKITGTATLVSPQQAQQINGLVNEIIE